eukprot:TRINITY_DN2698_c0_g1_i1.p1 TRINITY_DN2698_c0_g1~~TRINITY_DN2698_c0_g1_i1.p1  ORF type:complete len:356 (+),score=89.57 TRINITY_DN2698_c0_g1_i1:64-1131(+)
MSDNSSVVAPTEASEEVKLENELVPLIQSPPTEKSIREVFERHSSGNNEWTPADLRSFLMELQRAFGYPPFVPDDAVSSALAEMQLNQAAGNLSWVEFKSFFLYLHQEPFQDLHRVASASISVEELRTRSVMITNLPTEGDLDTDGLVDLLSGAGQVTKIYLSQQTGQAVGVFAEHETVAAAAALSGRTFSGRELTIEPYLNQPFPAHPDASRRVSPIISSISSVLAKGVIMVQSFEQKHQITEKVKSFDEEHKITETITSVGLAGVAAVKGIDEKYQVTSTISSKAREVDERFNITQRVEQAKQSAMQIPTVQRGLSLLGSMASKFSLGVSELKEDTLKKVRAQSGSDAPAPGQ